MDHNSRSKYKKVYRQHLVKVLQELGPKEHLMIACWDESHIRAFKVCYKKELQACKGKITYENISKLTYASQRPLKAMVWYDEIVQMAPTVEPKVK